MKKIKRILIALSLAIVMVFGVTGCNVGTQNDLQGKIDELQSQLEEMTDRLAEMEDQLLEIDELQSQLEEMTDRLAEMEEQISERDEKIEQLENELAEKSTGKFYTLQEAYNNGWLTQADLMSIAYYHNGGQRYNEEIMSENYEPLSKTPEKLSTMQDMSIRKTMLRALNNECVTDFVLDNVRIFAYYGTYSGGVAIRMAYSSGEDFAFNQVINVNSVDNVKFFYADYTAFFRTMSFNFDNSIMFWINS